MPVRSVPARQLLPLFAAAAFVLCAALLPAVAHAADPATATATATAPSLSAADGNVAASSTSASSSAFVAPKLIAGHVVQGTAGATVATGTQVTLTVSDSSGNTLKTLKQSVGSDGSFSFTGFPSQSGYQYQLGLLQDGQPEVMNLDASGGPSAVAITIYDSTSTMSDLSIPTQVMMIPQIDAKSRQIAVLELAEVMNSGDRSFVANLANPPAAGTMPTLLTFSLPKNYQNLQVESDMPDGGHTVEVGQGFALVNPVLPGPSRVVYRYTFPYKGTTATVDHLLPLGASEFRILYPAGQASITVPGMTEAPDAQIGTSTFKVLVANHVAAGKHLSIEISSLPQPTFGDKMSNLVTQSAWITVGAPSFVGFAMILLLGYALVLRRSRRRRAAMAAHEGDVEAAPLLTHDQLIESIALLDERHQAGDVPDEEYQTQRAELLAKLTSQDE